MRDRWCSPGLSRRRSLQVCRPIEGVGDGKESQERGLTGAYDSKAVLHVGRYRNCVLRTDDLGFVPESYFKFPLQNHDKLVVLVLVKRSPRTNLSYGVR